MKLVRVQGKVGGQWSADQFDHAYADQNTLGTVCPLPGTTTMLYKTTTVFRVGST